MDYYEELKGIQVGKQCIEDILRFWSWGMELDINDGKVERSNNDFLKVITKVADANQMQYECRQFFGSSWYYMLTKIDADELVARLERKAYEDWWIMALNERDKEEAAS